MHAVEQMSFFGEVPWHGLGNDLTGQRQDRWQEVIGPAGLDWKVVLETMKTQYKSEILPVPDARAVVRDRDSKVLGVVGDRYTPVQNDELFRFIDDLIQLSGNKVEWHTAGSLWEGKKVWVLARAPELDFEVTKGDKIEQFLLGSNSHDGSRMLSIMLTPVRVVCNNTLSAALGATSEHRVNLRHTGAPTARVAEVGEAMGLFKRATFELQNTLKLLASKAYSRDEMDKMTDSLLDIDREKEEEPSTRITNIHDEICRLFAEGNGVQLAPGTRWAAYNAVTEYVTHHRSTRTTTKRRDNAALAEKEARLESAWWGSGAALSRKAFDLLLDTKALVEA